MKIRILDIETLGIVKEESGRVVEVKKGVDIPLDIATKSSEIQADTFHEGKINQVFVNRFERDNKARCKCIEHYGAVCSVCEFDFLKKYGEIGKGFIHVHHIKPLHEVREEYEVKPIKDLIPVCPNCHAMLHHKGTSNIEMTVEELKELINKNRSK